MISDNLYLEAEKAGIIIDCEVQLPTTKSVSAKFDDSTMFIGIDDAAMRTRADERVHLAHELGHCMTGAFYNMYAPIDNRGWCERIANNYAIKKLIDEDELRGVIDSYGGEIGIWELAEYFDVTEDFMQQAVEYYFL
ncbi:MAG: ImmA/IrrE family metallo-endopeptidase [Clostridiales bacterium]|nr:ImmA/IrrE family metallo-endopeptidase [Clostridiales bacterium]